MHVPAELAPAEIWRMIAGMDLERKEVNSLARVSKHLRDIIQPFLYRSVDLTKVTRDSQHLTLKLIVSEPALARNVLQLSLPSYQPPDADDMTRGAAPPPPDVPLVTEAFRSMTSLQSFKIVELDPFWSPGDNTGGDLARAVLGRDDFLAMMLQERAAPLKHFTWERVDPDKFITRMHWEGSAEAQSDAPFQDVWRFMNTCAEGLQTLNVPICVDYLQLYRPGEDPCCHLWRMRFPNLRMFGVSSWDTMLPITKQVEDWCVYHAEKSITVTVHGMELAYCLLKDVNIEPSGDHSPLAFTGNQLAVKALTGVKPRKLVALARNCQPPLNMCLARMKESMKVLRIELRFSLGDLDILAGRKPFLGLLNGMDIDLRSSFNLDPEMGHVFNLDAFEVDLDFGSPDSWEDVDSNLIAHYIRQFSRFAGPDLKSWTGFTPSVPISAEMLADALSQSTKLEELTIIENAIEEGVTPEEYAIPLARRLRCLRRLSVKPSRQPQSQCRISTLHGKTMHIQIGRNVGKERTPLIEGCPWEFT